MKNIPVAGPSITQLEIDYVTDAVKTCWYSGANKYINKFEEAFAKHCHRRYAISLPNCTSGIHLALLALNIHQGDEVIVPDTTWIASAAPVNYVGADVVFADIRKDNLTIDHLQIEKKITNRTKAIIAVNLYGAMPDYESLNVLCAKYKLALIEDAAESVGSTYKQRPSGSFGDFSVFSFHGSKTITTGEGGMLLTDDEVLYRRCMILRDHGRIPGDTNFLNEEIAYKYKMTDLQAALGLAQLERVEILVEKKKSIQNSYADRLSHIKGIKFHFDSEDVSNSYWMSSIIWENKDLSKFDVIKKLKNELIDSRPIFSPLSSLKAYEGNLSGKDNFNSYDISFRGINLPSAYNIEDSDLTRVADTISRIFAEKK